MHSPYPWVRKNAEREARRLRAVERIARQSAARAIAEREAAQKRREAARAKIDNRVAFLREVKKLSFREISRKCGWSSARSAQIYQRVLRSRSPMAGLPVRAWTCLYHQHGGRKAWTSFTAADFAVAVLNGTLHPKRTKNYGIVTHRVLVGWLVARRHLKAAEARGLINVG